MEMKKTERAILNLNKKAISLYKQGQTIEALLAFQKAEAILRQCPLPKLELFTYNNMASFYIKEDNLDLSQDYLAQCCKIIPEDISSQYFLIGTLLNLTAVKSKLNKHKEAIHHALKAFSLLDRYPNECLTISCYYALALEYFSIFQVKSAENYLENGFSLSKKFFGHDHSLTNAIRDFLGICKKQEFKPVNEICILVDNFQANKKKHSDSSILQNKSLRNNRKNGEALIKIDTTPWLDQDKWKMRNADTPNDQIRKQFRRQAPSPIISKSVNLQEKIEFFEKNVKVIENQINSLRKVVYKSDKTTNATKVKAATIIQKAFRGYLRKHTSLLDNNIL